MFPVEVYSYLFWFFDLSSLVRFSWTCTFAQQVIKKHPHFKLLSHVVSRKKSDTTKRLKKRFNLQEHERLIVYPLALALDTDDKILCQYAKKQWNGGFNADLRCAFTEGLFSKDTTVPAGMDVDQTDYFLAGLCASGRGDRVRETSGWLSWLSCQRYKSDMCPKILAETGQLEEFKRWVKIDEWSQTQKNIFAMAACSHCNVQKIREIIDYLHINLEPTEFDFHLFIKWIKNNSRQDIYSTIEYLYNTQILQGPDLLGIYMFFDDENQIVDYWNKHPAPTPEELRIHADVASEGAKKSSNPKWLMWCMKHKPSCYQKCPKMIIKQGIVKWIEIYVKGHPFWSWKNIAKSCVKIIKALEEKTQDSELNSSRLRTLERQRVNAIEVLKRASFGCFQDTYETLEINEVLNWEIDNYAMEIIEVIKKSKIPRLC